MKTLVKVKIPLSSQNETISLSPPCTYCGEAVIEPEANWWEKKITYKERHWARGRKFGQMSVWESDKSRTVTLRVPYCSKHSKKPKTFNPLIFFGTAVIFTLLAMLGIWLPLEFSNLMTPDEKVQFVAMIIISGLLAFALGAFLGWIINNLAFSTKPELRDYPVWSATGFNNGFWGLIIDQVHFDSGDFGVGPIKYFLQIEFSNIESAQRFLSTYPTAKIIKGGELF